MLMESNFVYNKNIPAAEASFLKVSAGEPCFAWVGRVKRDENGSVRFVLPGVQIHARFVSDRVAVEVAPYSGYFMVELDDMVPFKVKSSRSEKVIEIASGLAMEEHRLTLTYCNEGELAPPVFYGLLLSAQGKMLDCPELPGRRMEFIGDSITCGYGNEDYSEDKAYPFPNVNNAYYSYARQTARLLHAQCVQVSRSGICLCYDRHTPGVAVFRHMQSLYPYTLFSLEHDGEEWDSTKYVPDVVCINLGTNDCEQPGFEKEHFAACMVEFIRGLRLKYKLAKFVLLSGPMLHEEHLSLVTWALDKAVGILKAEGDPEIYRFDFSPDDGTLDYGTLGHPSLKRHVAMAGELSLYLKQLMSW